MTSIFLRFVVLFIFVNHVYSELKLKERYLDIRTLKNIVDKTSRLFESINTSNQPTDKDYAKRMAKTMEVIVDKIAYYDIPKYIVDYFDNIKIDVMRKFTKFPDVKTIMMLFIHQIDKEYERFKRTLQILKNKNESTIMSTKPATYPDILKNNEYLHTMITSEDPEDETTFLEQIDSKTKVRRKFINCSLKNLI